LPISEQLALEALEAEPINWIAGRCEITDKAGQCCKLEANEAQRKLDDVIRWQRSQGKPVRIIILKARQQGMTTYGCAWQYCQCNQRANRNALMSAHDDDSSIEIFRKYRRFQETDATPRPEKYSSRKEITYDAPHHSSMLVKTAGKENLGRGMTIHFFHGSEVAFWTNAEKTLLSVMQCIPKGDNATDTAVILESTANGLGGVFYDRWIAAKRGQSDFYPLFLPWHSFHEYSVADVPRGFMMDDDEVELQELHGLTDGQILWRRLTIANDCGGNVDMFKQEYPSTDEEAFLVSGRPVFNQTALSAMAKGAVPPSIVGSISATGVVNDDSGHTEIWQPPVVGKLYAIGADVAEGLQPDEAKDPDSSSAHVIEVRSGDVVAKLSGRMTTDVFADDLVSLATWYNNALLAPEINNTMGGAVRESLKRSGYRNIYNTHRFEKVYNEQTARLGWRTDRVTRGEMLTELGKAIRDRDISVWSEQTVHQCRVFVYDKMGKATAQPGEHDDDVMSLAIAWQMVIKLSESGEVGEEVGVVDASEYLTFDERLCVSGAVDTFEDMGDDVGPMRE